MLDSLLLTAATVKDFQPENLLKIGALPRTAGLGLSITKAILDLHGGTVTCASQPGQGTVFQVWLPLG